VEEWWCVRRCGGVARMKVWQLHDVIERVMRCDAMRCDAMRCDAMRCDAMRCDAMRCDAMLCDAMRCDAMRCDANFVWTVFLGEQHEPLVESIAFLLVPLEILCCVDLQKRQPPPRRCVCSRMSMRVSRQFGQC
jgi:pentapeptide MXKDX repeat protein